MTVPPYYLRCFQCGGRAFYVAAAPERGCADRRVAVLNAEGLQVVADAGARPACQQCGVPLTLENLSVVSVRPTAP